MLHKIPESGGDEWTDRGGLSGGCKIYDSESTDEKNSDVLKNSRTKGYLGARMRGRAQGGLGSVRLLK